MGAALPGDGASDAAPPTRRSPLAWLGILVRGMAMGIAELVPGVSGGTIAFISGIYVELVGAVRAVDGRFFGLLARGRISAAARHARLPFLAVLGLGMGIALVGCAALVQWLLGHHEVLLWAFFFGLILASVGFVARFAAPWNTELMLLALLGLVLGGTLSTFGSLPPGDSDLITFASGAVAVCAWILPGISGSFILLLIGQYPMVIRAVADLDLQFLAVLGAGCVTGLALFSRLLGWLLTHHYRRTLALLCGFMGGSLQLLWPWRQVLSYYLDSDGGAIPILVRPISPGLFAEMYGEDPMIVAVILCALAGFATVMIMEVVMRRHSG